jgi:hypothetical protein
MKTYAICFAVAMLIGSIIIGKLCSTMSDIQPRNIAEEVKAAQR